MSLSTAFTAPVSVTSKSFKPSLRTSARPSSSPTVAPIRAALKPSSEKTPVQKSSIPADLEDGTDKVLGFQGFTPFAEKLNGRVAQMFFVIGLVTELYSGVPMSEQVMILAKPLENGAEAIEVTAQICFRIIEGITGSS